MSSSPTIPAPPNEAPATEASASQPASSHAGASQPASSHAGASLAGSSQASTIQDVLVDLRLDEQTWQSGSPTRRAEWRLCLDEVLSEGLFGEGTGEPVQKGQRGLLAVLPTAVELRLSTGDDTAPGAVHRIPVQSLRPLMSEYMDTIRQMARLPHGTNSPQLEALDIAKRITHDEAGDLVKSLLPSLRPSHGTARRLFTLLVTVFHDTSRIAVAHPVQRR